MLRSMLQAIAGNPDVRALVSHVLSCQDGCRVSLEDVAYCPEGGRLAARAAPGALAPILRAIGQDSPPGGPRG